MSEAEEQDLTARIEEALERVRSYVERHGGEARIAGIEQGMVRIRVSGEGTSLARTMPAIERAICAQVDRVAPEVERVEVEGPGQQDTDDPLDPSFIPEDTVERKDRDDDGRG